MVYLWQRVFRPVLVAMCQVARGGSFNFCAEPLALRIQHAKGQWRGKKALWPGRSLAFSEMAVSSSMAKHRSTKSSLRRWHFFPCMPRSPVQECEVLSPKRQALFCCLLCQASGACQLRRTLQHAKLYSVPPARRFWCLCLDATTYQVQRCSFLTREGAGSSGNSDLEVLGLSLRF